MHLNLFQISLSLKVELVLLLPNRRNIFFVIHRKRESVSQQNRRKKHFLVSFCLGLCVLCLLNTVRSVFSLLLANLVLKSPGSFSPRGFCKMDLYTPSIQSLRYKNQYL